MACRPPLFTAGPVFALCALAGLAPVGCSLGEGEGQVASQKLYVAECWDGGFDLTPDFFAAIPYQRTLEIRVQHGGDLEEVSDGLSILIDDIDKVAGALEQPLPVSMPVGVRPVGVPIPAYDPNPPLVHATLYLHRACHAQNSALYSVGGTVTFHKIFNGDPNESDADKRLTYADFSDIVVADPRDLAADGTVAGGAKSDLFGYFKFYFQRGQPAQPFP